MGATPPASLGPSEPISPRRRDLDVTSLVRPSTLGLGSQENNFRPTPLPPKTEFYERSRYGDKGVAVTKATFLT